MEIKRPLEWLKDEMPHIPGNGGEIALYEVMEALDQYADHRNDILIREHQLMKEALESIEHETDDSNIRITAKEALKKVNNGKS